MPCQSRYVNASMLKLYVHTVDPRISEHTGTDPSSDMPKIRI